MSDTPFYAKNGIVANTGFVANSTQVSLGANVLMTPSSFTIITSTGNISINATSIFIGNSTVNTTVNVTSGPGGGTSNQAAQYTWTNNHTFQANVTFSNGTVNFNSNILNQTLTFAANTDWDTSLGQVATLTLTGNTTINAPTKLKVGTYVLHTFQDATGNRNIIWNTIFKWPQGVAPVPTPTASHHDVYSFISDGANMYGAYLPDVR